MTEPTEFELLELATPYALNAIPDTVRAAIDRQLAAAPAAAAEAFSDEVGAVRETMAVVSAATAADPPARLRTAGAGRCTARHYTSIPLAHGSIGCSSGNRSGVGGLRRRNRATTTAHTDNGRGRSWRHRTCARSPVSCPAGTATVLFLAGHECRCAGDE